MVGQASVRPNDFTISSILTLILAPINPGGENTFTVSNEMVFKNMMSKSTSTTWLVGGALLLSGIAFAVLRGRSDPGVLAEIDELNPDDCIGADEVEQIFDRLFLEMQAVLSQLMQQIQAIQMTGQNIPENQLKSLLRLEMERALTVKQKLIIDEFGIDYECLEQATWEFLEEEGKYPKVKNSVERFQKLWESTTGEPVAGWRPGKVSKKTDEKILAPDRLIVVADKYFTALTECMRGIVEKYKAEGKNLQDYSVQQAVNLDFARMAHETGESALAKEETTLSQFEASIKEHSSNPTVGRALAMFQMRQQEELMAIGSG